MLDFDADFEYDRQREDALLEELEAAEAANQMYSDSDWTFDDEADAIDEAMDNYYDDLADED